MVEGAGEAEGGLGLSLGAHLWRLECEGQKEQMHRREELHALKTVGELRREKEPVGMPGAADGLDRELVLEFLFGECQKPGSPKHLLVAPISTPELSDHCNHKWRQQV